MAAFLAAPPFKIRLGCSAEFAVKVFKEMPYFIAHDEELDDIKDTSYSAIAVGTGIAATAIGSMST